MGRAAIALTVTGLLLLVGCGSGEGGGDSEGPLAVVASFYPLFEIADRVGGEHGRVTNLTPPGAEPHDVELTSRQVDTLQDADVVLYLSGGFQPAVEETVRDNGIDLLDGIDADGDPHVWLDPELMGDLVDAVEKVFADRDPAHAEDFAANARSYREELERLHADMEAGLRTCERRTLVVSHDAFGHLARAYDLEQEAVAGIAPEAEPDPARLAELADLVEREGVTTIFTETLLSPEVGQALARETGARTAVLNPLEGLTEEEVEQGSDYDQVMRANLAALRTALSCT